MWFFRCWREFGGRGTAGVSGDGAGGKILQENLTLLSTLTHLKGAKQSQSGSLSRRCKF